MQSADTIFGIRMMQIIITVVRQKKSLKGVARLQCHVLVHALVAHRPTAEAAVLGSRPKY